jgi:hypothetical protein
MYSRVFLCVALVATAACKKSGSGSKSAALPAHDSCLAGLTATGRGTEVSAKNVFRGKRVNWKLVKTEVYTSITNYYNRSQVAYQRRLITFTNDQKSSTTSCLGGEADVNFRFTLPAFIRGSDSMITSTLSGRSSGRPDGVMTHELDLTSSGEKEFKSEELKAPSKIKISQIDATTVEIWSELHSGENDYRNSSTLKYIHKSLYKAQPIERLDLFKEAFAHASTHRYDGGLGLTRDAAQTFATTVSAKGVEEGGRYLDAIKVIFKYSTTHTYDGGLGLNSEQALKFSDAVARKSNSMDLLETFKRSYKYASTHTYDGGLGLSGDAARKFAADSVGLEDAF